MKKSILLLLIIVVILPSFTSVMAQNDYAFYIRAINENYEPKFKSSGGIMTYQGRDNILKGILSSYTIYSFEKRFKSSKRSTLYRTFYVKTNDIALMDNLLNNASHLFEFGESLGHDEVELLTDSGETTGPLLLSYPNDYGPTGPLGANMGAGAILDQHDYLESPLAWDYTTGDSSIIIGISDSVIMDDDDDLSNKTTILVPGSSTCTFCPSHGTSQSANAAAQGDNAHGTVGVCYDCDIMGVNYGNYGYLLDLSKAGASVINCSWVSAAGGATRQECIDEIYENGTIVVASSGNNDWSTTGGTLFLYPASFNHVISVGTIGHRYDTPEDGVFIQGGIYKVQSLKNYIGNEARFPGNDPTVPPIPYASTTENLNTAVDILGTGAYIFSYGQYLLGNGIGYFVGTSGSAPHVSGTVGLMRSLNPCLSFEEVETVLKLTSVNIDANPGHDTYAGHYGSGGLQTGKAVKMVHDMMTPTATVEVKDQIFSRWNFILESAPSKINISDQIFKEAAIVDFKSKEYIYIEEETLLEPNSEGYINLTIDPTLVTCSGGKMKVTPNTNIKKDDNIDDEIPFTIAVTPNPSKGSFKVQFSKELVDIEYTLFDFSGNVILNDNDKKAGFIAISRSLNPGLYVVQVRSNEHTANAKILIE